MEVIEGGNLNDRIIFAYQYALDNAYRFERLRCYRADLAHEAILRCLENIEEFMKVKSLRAWIYKLMRNIQMEFLKKASTRYEKFEHGLVNEGGVGFYEEYAGNQLCDIESRLDSFTILDYINSKEFKSNNNYKGGNTVEIFEMYIEGYTSEEIAKQFNMKKSSVNTSTLNTRNKIKKKFNNENR